VWPVFTEIYLCRTYSCHEILRVELPGQGGADAARWLSPLAPAVRGPARLRDAMHRAGLTPETLWRQLGGGGGQRPSSAPPLPRQAFVGGVKQLLFPRSRTHAEEAVIDYQVEACWAATVACQQGQGGAPTTRPAGRSGGRRPAPQQPPPPSSGGVGVGSARGVGMHGRGVAVGYHHRDMASMLIESLDWLRFTYTSDIESAYSCHGAGMGPSLRRGRRGRWCWAGRGVARRPCGG
jgi:hypothetical protein